MNNMDHMHISSDNNLGQMYPTELELKDTTNSNTSAFNLDFLQIPSATNVTNTNVPFQRSNMPSSPAYVALFHSYTVYQGLLLLWIFYYPTFQ